MTTLIKLKNRGLAEGTLRNLSFNLKHLTKYADLDNPESVKEYVAKKNCANSQKMNLVKSYNYYAVANNIKWIKPYYRHERKLPRIPTEEQINKLIASASPKYATILKILAETGIGYNLLFDRVDKEVGSKATFNKYLDQLKGEGFVEKEPDLRHKRGVVLYRSKESEFELLKLDLIDRVREIFRETKLKPIELDEEKLGELNYASRRNVKIICNVILAIRQNLMKILPKIEEHYGSAPFLRATEADGTIRLQFEPANG